METNNGGRCGPLCQHPGCWESGRKKPLRNKQTQYEKYVDRLLRHRCIRHTGSQNEASENDGLPVLTVQSVALESVDGLGDLEQRPAPANSPLATEHSPAPQPPQLHNVEVRLEAAKLSSSSLSFLPVLIWRPGTPSSKHPAELSKPQGNVAVKNLADTLPTESSAAGRKKKTRSSSRPQSRPDSLDLLHDIPHYLVAEILHQLQSESTSTLSPPHRSPSPTHQRPDSCHVPSSLICDLSTGQLFRNTQPLKIPTTSSRESHPPTPPSPPRNRAPSLRRGKKTVTLPSVSKKTSFSRALSHSPMTVLRKTGVVPPPIQPLALHHTLLLPPNPLQPHHHYHSALHSYTRYPLGNPIVPRAPQTRKVDPQLAPYPPLPQPAAATGGRFLHIFPADIHNTRLVTLHCLSSPDNQTTITEESPPQVQDDEDDDAIHLPPIPSPSPPPQSLPSVSPDHMQLGAQIVEDQLVLDRAGEHMVHPLRDTSQSCLARTSSGGVVNGSLAPPPTAS